MTTFGGATIPPLFGGADADALFIRSVGLPFVGTTAGYPAGILPLPPTIVAGDRLVAFSGGSGVGPTGVNYTFRSNSGSPASGRIFDRIATNDINDNFNYNASAINNIAGISLGQIVCLASSDNLLTPTFSAIAGTYSVIGGEPIANFTMTSAVVGAVPNNTMVFGTYARYHQQIGNLTVPTIGQPTTLINLSENAQNTPTPVGRDNFAWMGWGYTFQAVSAAFVTEQIPFTPTNLAFGLASASSQYVRYRAI